MTKPVHVPRDWNPVIHILDELSEGAHSVTELLYSADYYDSRTYEDAMLYLASLPLIQFRRGAASNVLVYDEAAELFQRAMLVAQEERGVFSEVDVDLTRGGEEVLALFRLGHP